MTPQQIFDYKNRWMPGFEVTLHSDLEREGKDWCKRLMGKESWHFKSFTNIYQHSFYFEKEIMAQNFIMEFGRFTNQ